LRTSIRLIVGLGNPGREYAETRHNLGFIIVDAFAAARGAAWKRERDFEGDVARLRRDAGGDLLLLKPATYMNESGRSVAAFGRYFQITPPESAVVYDEINLPFGRTKLSISGSAGGHNGVASLLQLFGDGFRRFRIGIGPRDPPEIDLKDYVLGRLSAAQKTILQQNLPDYLAGLELLLTQGVARAMNQLNRRTTTDDCSSQD
jgi:peptidyl-tRNA hydrolase, PTH1 family